MRRWTGWSRSGCTQSRFPFATGFALRAPACTVSAPATTIAVMTATTAATALRLLDSRCIRVSLLVDEWVELFVRVRTVMLWFARMRQPARGGPTGGGV